MSMLSMEGIGKLANERARELQDLDRFVQEALDLFEASPDGIRERSLIDTLVDRGASISVASACADELISGGVARKNWSTGLLTHVR